MVINQLDATVDLINVLQTGINVLGITWIQSLLLASPRLHIQRGMLCYCTTLYCSGMSKRNDNRRLSNKFKNKYVSN